MLEVREVTKVYGAGTSEVIVLNRVSLEVNQGDFIAIMGPSGSGKSTLLNLIGGLDRLTSGSVWLEGERIDNLDEDSLVNIRRTKLSYIFQEYHLLASLTALENVLLPLTFQGGDAEDRAFELLERVGLKRRASHKPSQLSGGEQQRVAIARALINNPLLTLADEPTGNMDRKTGAEILGLFEELNREGRSIIMVTHNQEAADRAREIIELQDGQICRRLRTNHKRACERES